MSKPKPVRVSMCCHCGRLRIADTSPTFPVHTRPFPTAPGGEMEMCHGSFDVSRDPRHDRRKLGNGDDPPSLEDVERFANQRGK